MFWGLIAAYLVIIGLFAYWVFRQRGIDDFLIAGRQNSGLVMGAGIVIGWVDVMFFTLYATMAYLYGWWTLLMLIGTTAAAFVILSYLSARLKALSTQHNMYTVADWFDMRFGSASGHVVALISSLYAFGWYLALVISAGLLLHQIFHISYAAVVVTTSVVTLVMLLKGGYGALTRFDILQIALLSLLLTVVFCIIGPAVTAQAAQYDFTSAALSNFDRVNLIIMFFASTLVVPDVWQRLHAVRDSGAARQGFLLAIPLTAIMFTAAAWFGFYAKENGLAETDANLAFASALEALGPQVQALMLVAMIAATLSTMNVSCYAGASAVACNMGPKTTKEQMKRKMQLAFVGMIVLAAVIALVTQDVLTLALSTLTLTVAIAPAFVGGILSSRKVGDWAVASVMLLSVMSLVGLIAIGQNTGIYSLIPFMVSSVGTLALFFVSPRV
ncbi:MAG: hypothetical protein V4621_02450 [Pseudomonadota bacterium]